MRLQAALVKEQGVTFAVVVVKRHVLTSSNNSQQAQAAFRPAFPGVPIVLMAQDSGGTPTYYGRPDIVRFLSNTPMDALPWGDWTVNG